MQPVIAALPSKPQIDYMVDFYLEHVQIIRESGSWISSWLGRVLHESIFRTELDQFHLCREVDMSSLVDPAWIAQLVAVLWCVLMMT